MAVFSVRIERLPEVRAAALRAGRDAETQLNDIIKIELLNMVAGAKARFMGLSGTGPKAAGFVSSGTASGGWVQLREDTGYVFPREFGAKGPKTRTYWMTGGGWAKGWSGFVTRTIDYSKGSMFGSWTGNQHVTLGEGGGPGRAFYPSVDRGVSEINRKLDEFGDRVLDSFLAA